VILSLSLSSSTMEFSLANLTP